MAECEYNIPDPAIDFFIDRFNDLDPTGYLDEAYYNDYIAKVIKFAEFYGITLCDEPEAVLLGQFVQNQTTNPGGATPAPQTPEEFGSYRHAEFLSQYANLHGIDITIDRSLRYGPTSVVLGMIRNLTAEHSTPQAIPHPEISAQTGTGTVVLGQFDSALVCTPSRAQEFKLKAIQRIEGHYHRAVRSGRPEYNYQREKCGCREYSLRTDASWRSYAPASDGLTWNEPTAGLTGFKRGCCITDAKFVHDTNLTAYQDRRRFRRNLRRHVRTYRAKARKWVRRRHLFKYMNAYTSTTAQLGAYFAACVNRDIPFNNFLFICSESIAAEYFEDRIGGNNMVAKACHSVSGIRGGHWRMPEDPAVCPQDTTIP